MRKSHTFLLGGLVAVAAALLWVPAVHAQHPGRGHGGGGGKFCHHPGPGTGVVRSGFAPGLGAYGPGIGTLGYSFGSQFGYGFGGFAASSPYSLGQVPVPPYFAIHPPVYYSYPVARPYGYSPYAYPGWVRTPEIAATPPCPQELVNPYVEPTSAKTGESAPAEGSAQTNDFANRDHVPQHVVNPYVDHPSVFPPSFDMEVAFAK